jgi:phosphoribosylanthranilate isomerase
MTTIKICGITRMEDAALAVSLGVHALGFVLWAPSPRAIPLREAASIVKRLPPIVATVAVFVDPSLEEATRAVDAGFGVVQVHGAAPAWEAIAAAVPRAIRAVRLAADGTRLEPAVGEDTTVLLDAHDPVRHGGTGQVIDWSRAAAFATRRPVILAGGLTPANVGEAIRVVQPYGVDVASGVEERPGIKSSAALRAFVAAVHEAQSRSRHLEETRRAPL